MKDKIVLKSNTPETITRCQLLAQELGVEFEVQKVDNVLQFPTKEASPVVSMADVEKKTILEAIQASHGNMSKVAKTLGIGRATLYRKIKVYEIPVKEIKVA